jgi:hypothetical protein
MSRACASATATSSGELGVVGAAAVPGEGALPVDGAAAGDGWLSPGEAVPAASPVDVGAAPVGCTSGGNGLKIGAPVPVFGVCNTTGWLLLPAPGTVAGVPPPSVGWSWRPTVKTPGVERGPVGVARGAVGVGSA